MRNRSWVSCRGWLNCFACVIDHGLVAADGGGFLVVRSWMNVCGSKVSVHDPRTIAQSSDTRFAQQNPRIT